MDQSLEVLGKHGLTGLLPWEALPVPHSFTRRPGEMGALCAFSKIVIAINASQGKKNGDAFRKDFESSLNGDQLS